MATRAPTEVLDDVYELFMDLGADEHQIEFPVVYTNAKAGTATRDLDRAGHRPPAAPGPARRRSRPRPSFEPDHPLQLLVTNLSANEYVGRMAVGRIRNGTIRMGQRITVVREEADDTAGSVEPGRTVTLTGTVTSLQTAHGIERVDIEEAGPGDIVVGRRACPRSPSATRSPILPIRGRCRGSTSTSRRCG